MHLIEVVWKRPGRSAKLHTASLCRCNALCLPLPDVGALVLRHKGEHLQHDVAQKSAHQVFAAPGIQQRHIQHYDVDAFLFRQYPPLLQNLPIVPAQTVDALDVEQIVLFHFSQQAFVLGSVKILAGLLVHVNVFFRDSKLLQSDALPVLVLVLAANPDISVNSSRDLSHLPALLPNNVVPQHIGQLHSLAVAQAAAFQLV